MIQSQGGLKIVYAFVVKRAGLVAIGSWKICCGIAGRLEGHTRYTEGAAHQLVEVIQYQNSWKAANATVAISVNAIRSARTRVHGTIQGNCFATCMRSMRHLIEIVVIACFLVAVTTLR